MGPYKNDHFSTVKLIVWHLIKWVSRKLMLETACVNLVLREIFEAGLHEDYGLIFILCYCRK